MSTVRIATATDAPSIARVHVTAWQAAYSEILPTEYLAALPIEERQRGWTNRLSQPFTPETMTLVVETESGVVGFASLGRCRDEDRAGERDGELQAINLEPAAWGKKLGLSLALECIAVMEQSFDSISLWVLEQNHRAIGFYESLGFVRDGDTKERQFGDATVTELRYIKTLRRGA